MQPSDKDLLLQDDQPAEIVQESPATEDGQHGIEEELAEAVLSIESVFEARDRETWYELVRQCEKLDLYWNNIFDIIFDPASWTWMRYAVNSSGVVIRRDIDGPEDDDDTANQSMGIYRAIGLSMIAALSASIPVTRFFPDDADNQDDVSTSKAASKISELIQKQNNAPYLLMRALTLLWNGHFVMAWVRQKRDASFGTIKVPIYGKETADLAQKSCPMCGDNLGTDISQGEQDYAPMDCMGCGQTVEPIVNNTQEEIPTKTGEEEIDKGREVVELFGPKNVFIPSHISDPSQSPYIILEFEQSTSLMKSIFPHIADRMAEARETEYKSARGNIQAGYNSGKGTSTVRVMWVKPWAYWELDGDERTYLQEQYPDGFRSVKVDNIVAECIGEIANEHTVFSKSPLTEKIQDMPQGKPIIPVQDMQADLTSIIMDTAFHGIGETFVDSEVINADVYGKHRNRAGNMFPVRARRGMGLETAFYQQKNASLSKEVGEFYHELDQKAQFLSGVFPSIYGGYLQEGSNTLGEYRDSRDQALQRLSIIWKIVNLFWAEMQEKAVKDFCDNLLEDEKYSVQEGKGYKNIWIRRAELGGRIGRVESETSEQFPVAWTQVQATVQKLIETGEPHILAALFHPENTTFMSRVFGLTDLYIPGEDDRDKQKMEIMELLESAPLPDGSPSVPVDPDIDNHPIHKEVLLAFMNSDVGYEMQRTNPEGWANLKAHFAMHNMFDIPQPMPVEGENPPDNGGMEPY